MPRGLVLRDGAWVETEVTHDMFLDSKGRPWPCSLVSNCGKGRFSQHRIVHPVGRDGITHMVITLVSVCKGFNIARPEGTLIYAVDTSGCLVDYNPQNIVIPCMIPQMVQTPSLAISGNASSGIHLRSSEVCREMRERSTVYISQITVSLIQARTRDALYYGTLWFVILSDRYIDASSQYALDVADENAVRTMRDTTLPKYGISADIWERLPDVYIYIVYTVDSCIEDITHAPMVTTLLANLINDEDAMILASHNR